MPTPTQVYPPGHRVQLALRTFAAIVVPNPAVRYSTPLFPNVELTGATIPTPMPLASPSPNPGANTDCTAPVAAEIMRSRWPAESRTNKLPETSCVTLVGLLNLELVPKPSSQLATGVTGRLAVHPASVVTVSSAKFTARITLFPVSAT